MAEIQIQSGEAPAAAPFKSRNSEIYAKAATLKGGQWFEWSNPPKQIAAAKNALKKLSDKLTCYRAVTGKTIVKHTGEPEAPAPVAPTTDTPGIYLPKKATPLPTTGLTREQREAAASRLRQSN